MNFASLKDKVIYLAGGIGSLSKRGREWREEAAALLQQHGAMVYSPAHAFMGCNYSKRHSRYIDKVNREAIRQSDAVLINLRGAGIGTAREIEGAVRLDIPVVGFGLERQCVAVYDIVIADGLEGAVVALADVLK